jgi:hypothetical protein
MNPTTDVFEKRVAALEGGGDAHHPHTGRGRRRNRLHHLALRRHLQSFPLHAAAPGHQGQVCRCRRFRRAARPHQLENPRPLHRDPRQPQARHRRHRTSRCHRPRAQAPARHRQHLGLACSCPAHRVGRGHRRQFGHQIPRRPRHGHRRRHCRRRQVRLGCLGPLQGLYRARSFLPRPPLH